MTDFRCAVGLALLAGMALLPGLARGQADKRLERIRTEIEERETRASAYAEEAEGYLGELEAVDRELAELRRSRATLREHASAAEEDLATARQREQTAERDLTQTRESLGARLVALYKFTATGGLPALYSARDFQSAAGLGRGLSLVVEEDARLFARYREASKVWERHRRESQSALAGLAATRLELASRGERARRTLVERRNLVSVLRSRADRESRAAEELRAAARKLEIVLRDMAGSPLGPAGPGLRQGRVPVPAEGLVRLGFGRQVDPEFGTETQRSGIEIAAEEGAPVHAVAIGKVLFAGWFRGYGQMVILDHGSEYMTVSGYLAELRVQAGDQVEAEQVIGTVGQTGSLSGPSLYFEIRVAGRSVDPQIWFE